MPNRHTTDNNYRYAFQGQEKDLETGMEAFELRLWDGRIGRWLNPDPYGQYHSLYLGMGNNPINGVDKDGGWFWPPESGSFENGYIHTDVDGSWTFNDNVWKDNTGTGLDYEHGTTFLNNTIVGIDRKTGFNFFWTEGRSRLRLPGEYLNMNGNLSKYLKLEDVIESKTAKDLNISNMPSKEHIENLKSFGKYVYDPLYENFQGNIKISSGYRSKK